MIVFLARTGLCPLIYKVRKVSEVIKGSQVLKVHKDKQAYKVK